MISTNQEVELDLSNCLRMLFKKSHIADDAFQKKINSPFSSALYWGSLRGQNPRPASQSYGLVTKGVLRVGEGQEEE